jgi:hypothetical protein
MGIQADLRRKQVRTFSQAGKRRGIDLMSGGTLVRGQLLPAPTSVPPPRHKQEICHFTAACQVYIPKGCHPQISSEGLARSIRIVGYLSSKVAAIGAARKTDSR